MLTTYQIIFTISSLFGTYTIYKFIHLFFEEQRTSKTTEINTYLAYFFITLFLSHMANIPVVLLITNILLFIALTWNYYGSWKDRIVCGVVVYAILATIEIIISVSAGYWGQSIFLANNFDQIIPLVFSKLLMYSIVLILEKAKRSRSGFEISNWSWISMVTIPLVMMYLLVLILSSSNCSQMQAMTAIICIFAINILVFYLYDRLQEQGAQEKEKSLLMQQNKHLHNQYQMIQTSQDEMKSIRHDWKNHINVMSVMLENKNYAGVDSYLKELKTNTNQTSLHSDTGNPILDSILNYKITEAERQGVSVQVDVNVPEAMDLNSYDFTSLLGNLFDNALEAIQKCQNEKVITLKVNYSKGRLLLSMANPFDGNIRFNGDLPTTSKKNASLHGVGLQQIRRIINKYQGDLAISTKDQFFSIKLLMYL